MIARIAFPLMMLALVAGCGQSAAPPPADRIQPVENVPAKANGDAATAAPSTSNAPSADSDEKRFEKDGVAAEIASWDEAQQFVAKQQGKVVVLDAWSTYCVPCLREFPNLVALQKKYSKRVVCVSFNLNYAGIKDEPPQAAGEEIMTELAKQKSALKNIISSTADGEFYETVGLASIPAVFVYGPDGKLKKRFDNDDEEYGKEGFTYEKQIIPLIEELLAE